MRGRLTLRGKVAAVTGGSSGIGLATSVLLARRGARVYILARDADRAARAMAKHRLTGRAEFIPTDVADSAQVKRAFSRIGEAEARLDFLVCSAGVLGLGALEELEEELWDQVYDVNVKGCYLACRHALPLLRKSPSPSIVLIASIAGLSPYPRGAAYCSSKAAVIALARVLALELASEGIRVNCVAPGVVRTPMIASLLRASGDADEAWARTARNIPLGRVAEPSEVAELIVYLLAVDGYCTGAVFTVDGGITAGRPAAAVAR